MTPDWIFTTTPHEKNLGWETDWASVHHDPALIGRNGRNGHDGSLGEYLPRVHYLRKEDFERLGGKVTPERVPIWTSR